MKRIAFALALATLCLVAPAFGFWQSRDSNYNLAISGGGASFTGTGDVVSGFSVWWSPGVGYNAAYAASGTNPAADVCDSGGTNCITLAVGTNGYVAAPGATACGGNPCVSISKLYDQSGGNNCSGGPCNFTQATNASRPLLRTDCGGGSNRLCAEFTSTGLVMDTPSLTAISQGFTVPGVMKITQEVTGGEVFSVSCSTLYGIGGDGISSSTFDMNAATDFNNTTTVLSPTGYYSAIGVYSTTSSISSVNGTQTGGTVGVTRSWSGVTHLGFVGCYSGSKPAFYLTEIGIHPTAMSAGNVTAITSRQRTNWAF